jgi:hypothetical protein
MVAVTKIRNFLSISALLQIKMNSNFNCSYMAMSSLTYILGFFVRRLFSGFRGEDLNVIFYQNMPNLHNLYKSGERKIPQKNSDYM